MISTLKRWNTRDVSLVGVAIFCTLALVVRDVASSSGSLSGIIQRRNIFPRDLGGDVVTITINACPATTISPSLPTSTRSTSSILILTSSQTSSPPPSTTTVQTSLFTPIADPSSTTTTQTPSRPTLPASSINSPIPASSTDYKSPCDIFPVPTGDIYIYLHNTTGPDPSGYEYTLRCNTYFVGLESIEILTTLDYNACLAACYQWNQVFDQETQSICYSVTTSPASSASELTCHLQPPPVSANVFREGWNSAIWIAD